MKIKKELLVVFFAFIFLNINAQVNKTVVNGYTVTINTKNLAKEKLLLYMAYGPEKQMAISDSCTIKNNNQKVIFKKTGKLYGVIYFLKFASQKNEIELAIDNNTQINLSIDNNNIETIICTENNLNKDFLKYQKEQKELDIDKKTALRTSLLNKYPNTILNLYFKVENKIYDKIPENLNDKITKRNNFFSFIDKNENRIYLLPNLFKLLYFYVNITPINNENYIKNIDIALNGIDCKSNNYIIYVRWFLSNLSYFESLQLDLSYNHLFKNYIEKNKCKSFSDAEFAGFKNKYDTNILFANNKKVPNIELVDKNLIPYSLEKIYPNFDFTFIAFYSPTCHHCQIMMPFASDTFANLKLKYPTKKIQLIAIENDSDESKWEQFVTDKKLSNWLNLKSIDTKRLYQDDFNAYSNPNVFLIDKSGSVLLKTFNPKAIEELIQRN